MKERNSDIDEDRQTAQDTELQQMRTEFFMMSAIVSVMVII